jgi:protoporphyrinogen oxidase
MPNDDRPVVVIGAGPAGLTAAYDLVKRGERPVVLEKAPIVGGLARTESYKGFRFDMGGHRFFTKAPEVKRMWHEVLGGDLLRRPRLSRIYYRKTFFAYPLKPLNAILGLGIVEGIRIVLSYLRWQLFPHPREDTFEEWVTNRFGKRLFETFFKAYTEKVWGIPCSELKAEWAAQRIKDLSLRTALLNTIFKPKRTIRTLIEEFDYPRLGPGMMWEAVRNAIDAGGGQVCLDHGVVRLRRDGQRIGAVVAQHGGREVEFTGREFLSSMPVSELIQKLDPPAPPEVLEASRRLAYRDFLTVCLILKKRDLFPDNWIYVQDPEVRVGRIQNFGNWSPSMLPDPSRTSLGLEYFCNEGDDLWTMPDEMLIDLGRRELERIGLARREDVEDGCVFRVEKAYPIYDSDYAEHLGVIRSYVDGLENFQTIGRNGLHRYNNQDHAMLTGMLAVENLLDGRKNDLWAVNTDLEYHEEIEMPEIELRPEELAAAVDGALRRTTQKLDRTALGVAIGTVGGLGLFLATVWLLIAGGPNVGANLRLIGQFFPGFSVTPIGAVVGFVYAFVVGFGVGWFFALARNALVFLSLALSRRGTERQILKRLFEHF